jgi:hypothetical protein
MSDTDRIVTKEDRKLALDLLDIEYVNDPGRAQWLENGGAEHGSLLLNGAGAAAFVIARMRAAPTARAARPTPMLLWCPECGERHVDVGEFATKPHHTHACQHCGHCWRPAIVPTAGVRFLPGFKNEVADG